ncbi:hypothetical protein [uncultured Sphingomonas sp.]|uniref:hypothetical protein n=1 Tax=uncultured Sphingomonas sp. TaxID=158754 RepID=UPI0025D47389|nr:hypothetical protein [uncultured Sphingomonas sp.]
MTLGTTVRGWLSGMKSAWQAMGPFWSTLLLTGALLTVMWLSGDSSTEMALFAAGGLFWAILERLDSRAD